MKKLLLSVLTLFIGLTFASAITPGFSVHVKVAGSSVAPYIWAWDYGKNYSNGTTTGNTWPGSQIQGAADANGYFTFTFPDGVEVATSKVIFNNGKGTQTANLPVSTETYFNVSADFQTVTTGIVTSIEPLNISKELTVVSNTIKFEGNGEIEIFNISGLSIEKASVNGNFISKGLEAGIYIVRINGKSTKVIVK